MGLAYGCTISNSVKFFPDKAGLVGGIATASYGISSVILPPVANALIDQVGVSKAFLYFGIVIICITGIFSQFMIKCPEDFVPVGHQNSAKNVGKTVEENDKNWKEMLTSPIFYVMLSMLFFGAVLGMMAISQASAIAQNLVGMTAANAAFVVSILALFNTFGRILAGSVSGDDGDFTGVCDRTEPGWDDGCQCSFCGVYSCTVQYIWTDPGGKCIRSHRVYQDFTGSICSCSGWDDGCQCSFCGVYSCTVQYIWTDPGGKCIRSHRVYQDFTGSICSCSALNGHFVCKCRRTLVLYRNLYGWIMLWRFYGGISRIYSRPVRKKECKCKLWNYVHWI